MTQGKRRPPIAGNISPKYSSKNFIAKFLMKRFFRDLDRLLCSIRVRKVLDVGCGEGHVSQHIADSLKKVLRPLPSTMVLCEVKGFDA